MTASSAIERPSVPDIDLEIDVSIEDTRWYGVEDDPPMAVKRAVRAAIGQTALAALGPAGRDVEGTAEISVVLGDDALVQGLNREFRDQDRPTNVLSFALTEGDDPSATSGGPVMLGDVVLAFDTVTREAREQSKSPRDHALHLVVHGVLHLMGYDHGTEAQARMMERMEQRALADLGVADPHLERPPPA